MSYANVDIDLGLRVATGDLFEKFWNLPENWVEPPNRARKGQSGVIRTTFNGEDVYVKKQIGHLHHSLRHPLGRPTALRELEAFAILNKLDIDTPTPLFCESRQIAGLDMTILVTRALDGYLPLSALAAQQLMTAAESEELILAVAKTLARLHRQRWQHSALYPTHIFVRRRAAGYRIALLDLEKLRRRLTVSQASRHDMQQFLRRKRCWDEAGIDLLLNRYQRELAAAA